MKAATAPPEQILAFRMPELPEVETIVRTLRPLVVGRRIIGVEFHPPLANGSGSPAISRILSGFPRAFRKRVRQSMIEGVERYGKNILFRLRAPKAGVRFSMVVHLGMTGRLTCKSTPEFLSQHTHLVLSLDSPGGWIHYDDIRRFGRIRLCRIPSDGLEQLGPDPLEISFEEFFDRLRQRHAMLKSLLLDQRFLRGLGNIYADESLFHARLHPTVPASSLGRKRALRLYQAIRQTLRGAIKEGGSSVANYVDGRGQAGFFQYLHRVYRRTGLPCLRCGCRIRKIWIASRSTHFCPRCQTRPRIIAQHFLQKKA